MAFKKRKDAQLPPEVKAFLESQGKTFAEWCREKDFNWNTARDVATGRIKGRTGLCRRIKRALEEEIAKMGERNEVE